MRLTLASLAVGALMPTVVWCCDPPVPPPERVVAAGAITVDGRAVFVPTVGEPVELLRDGPSTADLHDVVVTGDGRTAWVSECCEPVWGHWWEVEVGGGLVDPYPTRGYGLDLDPAEAELSVATYYELQVLDRQGAPLAAVDVQDLGRDVWDTMWVDGARIAVIEFVQPDSGNELRLVVTDDRLDGYREATGAVITTDWEFPWPRLAGVGEGGHILVFRADRSDQASDRLTAYDAETLARAPAADIPLPARATSASYADGHLVWVDLQQRLHVGDEVVPGRYTWAHAAGRSG